MSLALAVAVGGLFAVGTFLLLQRDLVRVVLGVAVVSQATFVYLIAMGGIDEGAQNLVPVLEVHGGKVPEIADPVVQALVLTAIVISLGTTALALVLSYRAYEENETMDVTEWTK
ncbi:sodium:proton antiporter [Halorubrum lacusprofundi]|jgi:multicomponent Na+:H+ antiporter subunit C|uniref:NADH-ubiquinone oxidoreductase chain 4L n=1 Tax=Halorubrum lacusprofundi (strain ATCC 49239 / DSM 5036 / JCM 8891 / ACAM 34) TaxID=416348 RepID=B9LT22_HALLT|nr:sodium:proton antiporter [Halorubrum lacusprofundi]ACM56087.1 NADH-ubiquinone oxidoreductase chain 4L [Halorubrum lacusprofundi ATCC 49239]MCG1005602.1 sodium:proton antiporter [Halorubrum lacusprofundi]